MRAVGLDPGISDYPTFCRPSSDSVKLSSVSHTATDRGLLFTCPLQLAYPVSTVKLDLSVIIMSAHYSEFSLLIILFAPDLSSIKLHCPLLACPPLFAVTLSGVRC